MQRVRLLRRAGRRTGNWFSGGPENFEAEDSEEEAERIKGSGLRVVFDAADGAAEDEDEFAARGQEGGVGGVEFH